MIQAKNSMVKNILLTGHPGVGKTTMLKGIINRFAHLAMSGFYTEEIREEGIRLGFKAVAMNGSSAVFAHRNFQTGPEHQVGKYGVNLEALETLVLAQLSPQGKAAHLVIVDEIAKMELHAAQRGSTSSLGLGLSAAGNDFPERHRFYQTSEAA